MEITLLEPQSYCAGVKLALEKLSNECKENKDLYVLGPIIHNKMINDYYESQGIQILDIKNNTKENILKNIKNSTVVFQAHGSSDECYKICEENNNKIIDATCPYVSLIHKKIKEKIDNNYDVIYIGKNGHEESEATRSISEKVHLIENINDINLLEINNSLIYATNQTTLSILDIKNIYDKLKEKFPKIIIDNKICDATYKRQKAILESKNADLFIVIGDKSSSNSKRLYELSTKKGKAIFINNVNDIINYDFTSVNSVVITSGASTPFEVVLEVKAFLEALAK